MKLMSYLFLVIALIGCKTETKEKIKDSNTDIFGNEIVQSSATNIYMLDTTNNHVDTTLHNHFKKTLFINENEKYSYEIYKEHLNGDSIIDAVITINRLEYAKLKAEESGKLYKGRKDWIHGAF